jgi:uncharacterized protein YndB with AHSA1/START domain
MRLIAAAFAALAFSIAGPASAEVAQSSPSTFIIEAETTVAATPHKAFRDLGRVDRWWNSAHTYSRDAARLRLDMRAGGCWCERWDNQSVEHMRVVLVMEHEGVRTFRAVGGLGPLQEMGVSGVLTFTVAPDASGAKITMTYRVSGDPSLGLDQIAPAVDMVLLEQFQRLARYTATGSPD